MEEVPERTGMDWYLDFVEMIKKSAEYLDKADDAGSVDFEFSRLWDYFHKYPTNGLDENGGI